MPPPALAFICRSAPVTGERATSSFPKRSHPGDLGSGRRFVPIVGVLRGGAAAVEECSNLQTSNLGQVVENFHISLQRAEAVLPPNIFSFETLVDASLH